MAIPLVNALDEVNGFSDLTEIGNACAPRAFRPNVNRADAGNDLKNALLGGGHKTPLNY
jgi:hypothetical protein